MSGEVPVTDARSAGASKQSALTNWSRWCDCVGVMASIGCAIHCAALPFAIAYLPAFGLSFLADEGFHKWMAVGCFVIALTAFVPGLRKHGRFSPVIFASVGLVMISIAAFGLAGECCAACDSHAASVGLVTSDLSGFVAPSLDSEGCTDDCCALCADDQSATDSMAASATPTANDALRVSSWGMSELGSRIAPWLTPLGGIVLVSAHLLNRRFGCLCCAAKTNH